MITVTQAKQVAIDRIAYEMEILQRGKSMVSAAADAQIKEAEISLGGLGALFPEDSGAINAELLKVCTAQIKAIITQAETSKRQFDDDIAALAALSDEVLSLAPTDFGAKPWAQQAFKLVLSAFLSLYQKRPRQDSNTNLAEAFMWFMTHAKSPRPVTGA